MGLFSPATDTICLVDCCSSKPCTNCKKISHSCTTLPTFGPRNHCSCMLWSPSDGSMASGVWAPVNVPHVQHSSPLKEASARGHLILVEWLIKNGADVNAQSRTGTALQAASYCGGHKSIAQLLIAHGANVNAKGGPDGNALWAARCRAHGHCPVAH
jgi:hypothetical protein